ncbi:MAG: hypothetical protein JSS83_14210 [Cyanobacteria bacterium SZAS LIN-3]|nr:hypothetical protein [Cyanobacteria bacterium SZAS LIN-3]
MKLNILITALTAVMAIGSACQAPAEAKNHCNARHAQYNITARQRWEQNQAALMRRNRNIQQAQRHGANYRYNKNYRYNNGHHHHHN